MIKVLTETEYKFLKEFIALIEKYNLLFTTDEKGEIEVTVHRQQLATETNQNSDLLHTPIHLGDCFDETELNYILDQTDERIKQIAEELTVGRVHHGHNIRRFRIEKNMNQEVLSQLVHLSQSAVSKYEQMRVIDDEMLHRFSRALGVPFEYLKSLEEDAQTVVFENNTVNNNDQASANIGGYVEENNRVNNYNPIEKITELYERLLKEKDEKYAALERRLQNIEQSLQK